MPAGGSLGRWLGWVFSIQHGDVADAADELRARALQQFREGYFTLVAISGANLDLEQFVVIKRDTQFQHDGVRHTGVSDVDARFECVGKATQAALFGFCGFHGRAV